MKKWGLVFVFGTLLLAGCTTKEQEQQIRLFWLQQYSNLMMKKLASAPAELANNPQFKKLTASLEQSFGKNLPAQPAAARPAQPQIMEVSMSEDLLPGKASEADRTRMKRALEAVQLSNQSTLTDIAATFGNNVKYQAFLITAQTERQLKKTAEQSATFTAYFQTRQQLLKEQDRQINELLRKNTASIKNIRR